MVYALLSTFLREALETDLLDDDIRDVPAAMSAVSVYLIKDFVLTRVIWTDKNSHWLRRDCFWRKSWRSAEFQREGLDHGEISFCRRYSRNAECPGGGRRVRYYIIGLYQTQHARVRRAGGARPARSTGADGTGAMFTLIFVPIHR